MSERDTAIQDPNYDAELPAASAFTNQAYSLLGPHARRLTIGLAYTKHSGATTNQLKLQVQWKLVNQEGYFEPLLDGSNPTTGGDVMQIPEYKQEVLSPPVTSANSPFFWRALTLEVPCCAIGVRVIMAEVGDASHPGTVTARLFYSDVL